MENEDVYVTQRSGQEAPAPIAQITLTSAEQRHLSEASDALQNAMITLDWVKESMDERGYPHGSSILENTQEKILPLVRELRGMVTLNRERVEEHLNGNNIEPGLGKLGDRLTPEEIEIAYGGEAPETISERLRVKFGAALAEAEGIEKYRSSEIRVEGSEASAPRLPFIEQALAEGANIDHISVGHADSKWTIVSFENTGKETYLVKGKDVYVTQTSVEEAQAAIEDDPIRLSDISDLKRPDAILILVPDVSFSKIIASMGPNNRTILESALNDGAVVDRFWAEPSGENPDRYAMAVVSFKDSPGAYIFWNGEDDAHHTQLDFGKTRYDLDFGYEINDLRRVSEIKGAENKSAENKIEQSDRAQHSLSM